MERLSSDDEHLLENKMSNINIAQSLVPTQIECKYIKTLFFFFPLML